MIPEMNVGHVVVMKKKVILNSELNSTLYLDLLIGVLDRRDEHNGLSNSRLRK